MAQSVEDVGDSGDPPFQGNLFAAEAARIAGAVPPLVMRHGDAPGHLQRGQVVGVGKARRGGVSAQASTRIDGHLANDPGAEFAMAADDFHFVPRQLAALQENLVGNADFAHVVQRGSPLDLLRDHFGEAEASGDDAGVAAHSRHVPARPHVVVAALGGAAKVVNHLQPQGRQLQRLQLHLPLEVAFERGGVDADGGARRRRRLLRRTGVPRIHRSLRHGFSPIPQSTLPCFPRRGYGCVGEALSEEKDRPNGCGGHVDFLESSDREADAASRRRPDDLSQRHGGMRRGTRSTVVDRILWGTQWSR